MTQLDNMSTQLLPFATQLDSMSTQCSRSSAGDRLIVQLREIEVMSQGGALSSEEASQARHLLLGFAASGA